MHVSMRINAAIETLLTSDDLNETDAAAREIISYGDILKSQYCEWEYARLPFFRWPKWFQGNAAGIGDLTIKEEVKKDEIIRHGTKKERIGHYRLWKVEKGVLKFHHFWAASSTTQGETKEGPQAYYLFYDHKSLGPRGFGYEEVVKTWRFNFFGKNTISILGIRMVFGTAPRRYQMLVNRIKNQKPPSG